MLVSLIAVGAYAQLQTGNIYGTVEGNDGAALPGVTVTLTGVGAPRTTVTDAQGQFRFLSLDPGAYSLKAELAGYGTATRSGISVNVGRNADVTMTLNPSVTQTITVTAEAPLLDVRRTGTGATVTKVELESVPTGRDPWVILQQTPGVLMDRINVGGNESGQQSGYTSKGTVSSQSTWNVDGVNITDVGALGSSPTYYDFDSFEEMQLTTGGTDPRIQTPGVQVNMVTKRGTNDLRGSLRYFLTSGDWQSDPQIPDEAALYLGSVNEIDNIEDYGVEAGGPIVRDRFWLWGAYSKQQIDLLTGAPVGQTRRFTDKTELETLNGKGNAQLGAANSLSIAAMVGNKIKLGRNVGPTRFPETAWNQDSAYNGPTMWKIEDTHVFGPSFYLTGLYSKVQGGFQLIADNGNGCEDYDCGLDSLPSYWDLAGDGAWHRSFASYVTVRPQKQYRGDASTFFSTGALNHELKFGLGFRDAEVSSDSAWPEDYYIVFGNDPAGTVGTLAGIVFQRPTAFTYNVEAQDFYVGDTMMWGNLTVQAGLRWDNQKTFLNSGSTTANATIPDILPAISFNGSDIGELEWDSLSPRIGLTYTLGSQRKTLLRAAANRYVDQLGGTTSYLPAPTAYQYIYMYMNDLNGDLRATRNEIDFAGGILAWGGVDPNRLDEAVSLYRWDPDMDVPHTDEFLIGAEHELFNNFTLGATYTHRTLSDFIGNRAEKTQGRGDFYTHADYTNVVNGSPVLATCAASPTACGPFTSGYSVPYYVLKPGVAPPTYFVITNIPGYEQEYSGLELTATKRMANRWMLRGNFTWSDWSQTTTDESFADPSRLRTALSGCSNCDGGTVIIGSGTGSGAKGGVYINAEWAYNLTGAYQIPVIETTLGFNLTGRQGYPIPYIHRATTSEGFKFVLIEDDPAERRHDDIHTLDLRLAKDLRFGGVGLTVSADVFNVLNDDTILQRNTRINTGTRNRITEIVSPRVFRVGARLTF